MYREQIQSSGSPQFWAIVRERARTAIAVLALTEKSKSNYQVGSSGIGGICTWPFGAAFGFDFFTVLGLVAFLAALPDLTAFVDAFFASFLGDFFLGLVELFLTGFFAVFFFAFVAVFLTVFLADFFAGFLVAFFTIFLADFLASFLVGFLVLDFFTAFLAMRFRVAFFAATLPPDLFAISDE